jgi:hypothetical protein
MFGPEGYRRFMTTIEPLLPHPDDGDDGAAADPGPGAPDPAPGFGVDGEEPDLPDVDAGADRADVHLDTPFRTPDPEVD